MIITKDEFLEWKQSDVTVELFNLLKKKREEIKENLVSDVYDNEEFVKGKALVMLELIEMKYEDMMEELYDKPIGHTPERLEDSY